jgi:hypothetical protein
MRIEVFYKQSQWDGRANKLLAQVKTQVSTKITQARVVEVFLVNQPGSRGQKLGRHNLL